MPAEDGTDLPASQQAVLDELERLHAQIESARRRRADANDEFDSFLRSIGGRSGATVDATTARPPKAPPATVRAHARDADAMAWPPGKPGSTADAATTSPRPEPAAPSPPVAAPVLRPGPEAAPPAAAPRRAAGRYAAAAILVLAAAALFAWKTLTPSQSADRPSPEPGIGTPARPAPEPAVAAPQPPAPPPAPLAEVTTSSRVWLRLVVDGERTLEREVEANARIPLTPRERLIVRAGDGAAVRVLIRGEDQGPLGRPGMPVTRAFTIQPASAGER
jgi:hypothetical protein